ncbi:BREX-3 system P-loop-containing protein BrxF [Vibrio parahaemolyticus]|uniref:BREX-3 system P-loop-containing protein BrxF n=1 Tax=Vibrio parahaemolyticus TaxID=670 RepID=UPI00084AE657|nr:BREX-3 system P-loop-containing protein BrxF [Vibrio parahaemolyticus]AYO04913.1 BREX-3 system P-loop-containing protein BrxF [Vibrio parahaemolyticus]EGQ9442386.1 BREX-3 system P-loop-containing protein BrxF [Vibrio parahaemolyticus]EGQ9693546.1 BREX-3 system P-loop-containing protein BrxF [Vibrio parahaemolyticus]EGR1958864.1 BREX-3 system P-loop-containing protein BrxF [Vibrio parahaemolyticus]EGR1968045.1 BREX-3 system P-loop-containing protein BrxF [Vibrio parahaemolyticus]
MSISITSFRLTEQLLQHVQNACLEAEFRSFKLVLVVIPEDSRREIEAEILNNSIGFVNLSKELARKLISLSISERVRQLETEVKIIANECNSSVWLTKLDVLFEPALANDPMRLLKGIAKSKAIVAIWPGEITETSVVYSKPGKPDYKTYPLVELNDIQVIDACNGVINEEVR